MSLNSVSLGHETHLKVYGNLKAKSYEWLGFAFQKNCVGFWSLDWYGSSLFWNTFKKYILKKYFKNHWALV